MRSWFLMGICLIGRVTGNLGTRTYSCRSPITTCASVEAFTLLPLRIARIVLRSSPVFCSRVQAITWDNTNQCSSSPADEASDGRLGNLKTNLLDVLAKRKFNGIVRAPATRRPIIHPSKVNSLSDFGMKHEPVAALG